jgi:hypothetical protein
MEPTDFWSLMAASSFSIKRTTETRESVMEEFLFRNRLKEGETEALERIGNIDIVAVIIAEKNRILLIFFIGSPRYNMGSSNRYAAMKLTLDVLLLGNKVHTRKYMPSICHYMTTSYEITAHCEKYAQIWLE